MKSRTAKQNPFATHRLARLRFRPVGLRWEELLERLRRLDYRAAIVGAEGAGKSTLLRDLGPKLQQAGWEVASLRLTEENPRFEPGFLRGLSRRLTGREIILLDGAEQLGWLGWSRFCRQTRRARGLVITTHRAGRLPTLLECRTTARLLAEIAAELLAQAPDSLRGQAETLFAKHLGNLRDALWEWYDIWAVGH